MPIDEPATALDSGSSGAAVAAPGPSPTRVPLGDRLGALGEVTLCSGFPTQLGLVVLFGAAGVGPLDATGGLSLTYVFVLSVVDAIVILSLVCVLLWAHGERPVATLVGPRPLGGEAVLGLALTPVALLVVAVSFSIMTRFAPWLHNVPENPLEALIRSPTTAVLFAVVAVVAGGLREEVQRAFVLHRFEQHLGGAANGLIVFSVAFGLGHLVQGRDAAIVTGLLGALWGILYLTRRSVVAPIVCHSVFNLTEVMIAYARG